MSEVLERKAHIDRAITSRDPVLFAANLCAWLEATAFLRSLPNLRKLGLEPEAIPAFEAADLRDISVRKEADDAVMAFCISVGLARDSAAFASLDRLLTERFGVIYPGSSALYHCNQIIDPIETLDDAVGQIVKALLEGELVAPKAIWHAGLRFLQRLRSSSFETKLAPLLADWLRRAFRRRIADPSGFFDLPKNTAAIEFCLDAPGRDQAFIAALLSVMGPAVDPAIPAEYLVQLAKLAGRS